MITDIVQGLKHKSKNSKFKVQSSKDKKFNDQSSKDKNSWSVFEFSLHYS